MEFVGLVSIKGRIPDAVLAKARTVWGSEEKEAVKPTLFECHGGVCVLVLDRASEEGSPSSCVLLVRQEPDEPHHRVLGYVVHLQVAPSKNRDTPRCPLSLWEKAGMRICPK